MHRYAEAAEDARRAIELSSARPLDIAAAAFPGFNDAKIGNWLWAITVNPKDRIVTSLVVNFPSHMCSLFDEGITSDGVLKCCGTRLYEYIKSQGQDVRLNWFTDEDGYGENLTTGQQAAIDKAHSRSDYFPYVNIKFDNYQKRISGKPASDIPLMRIEEMYLIEAEGLAMSGKEAEAKEKLTSFVRSYRNPGYVCPAGDAASLQEEIIWQRRAEFWGEGLVFFDKLRLQLDMDRYGDPSWERCQDMIFRIKGNSKWMLYRMPQYAPLVEGIDYEAPDEYIIHGSAGAWNE